MKKRFWLYTIHIYKQFMYADLKPYNLAPTMFNLQVNSVQLCKTFCAQQNIKGC